MSVIQCWNRNVLLVKKPIKRVNSTILCSYTFYHKFMNLEFYEQLMNAVTLRNCSISCNELFKKWPWSCCQSGQTSYSSLYAEYTWFQYQMVIDSLTIAKYWLKPETNRKCEMPFKSQFYAGSQDKSSTWCPKAKWKTKHNSDLATSWSLSWSSPTNHTTSYHRWTAPDS